MIKALTALLLTLCPAAVLGNAFEYNWQELAPGVWAGIRQDPFELPQEGNSVFVVTERGVIVFDAGGSPAMGESIVAKIRSVTDKPVTHVVISHWHGDHMRGLQSIRAAFPNAEILCHPYARDFIVNTQERWLKRRVSMVPNIRKGLAATLQNNKDPVEKEWLLNGMKNIDQLDRENNRTTYVIPDSTFTDRLVLHFGTREIQFLHLGNAHTAGDVVMWLPNEKIVATGDVVTAPIPLMPSPYCDDYVAVLGKIKALDFKTLVPGHGLVQHDAAYVDLMADAIQNVSAQMKALVAKGLSKDDAIAKVDLAALQHRFTHDDPFLIHRFHDYVAIALPQAAWLVETKAGITESF